MTFSTGLVGVEVSSDRKTSTPTRPVENVNDQRPTGKKHATVRWEDGGKIGKVIN